jgi:hypothetical protein
MKRRLCITLALVCIFVLGSQAIALENDFDVLVVNSDDWIDVYSGIMYANLAGKDFNFITSREHSTRLPSLISGDAIYLVESDKVPIVMGYKSTLEGKGFSVEERISTGGKTHNLELAEDLDVDSFVIIDDAYGYNAISVCPYAVLSNSYVLFVDEDNIDETCSFLRDKDAKILIYGHLPEGVMNRLEEFNPEVVDLGDKFDNNIEIVKRYREIKDVDQVTLTSGDFMELGLMRGNWPILFIGKDSVPDQVSDYVKSSGITVGELIGNELTRSAQLLKASTGISIFLKFGQGAGAGAGSASIRDLDLFILPTYPLDVTVKDISFNMLTNELEVVYKNDVDVFSYFKSSITVYVDDDVVQTVGERESVLIDAKEEIGSTYSLDLSGYDLKKSKLRADIFLQYGESTKSMERTLENGSDIVLVEIVDQSDIEITDLIYDKDKNVLTLRIKNKGPSSYVKPVLALVEETAVYSIGEKATRDIDFDLELSDDDLRVNEKVSVEVSYGERENFLIKSMEQEMVLRVIGGGSDLSSLMYPAMILLLLIVIVALLMRPKRKEDTGEKGLGKSR